MKKFYSLVILALFFFCGYGQTPNENKDDTLRSYSYVNVDAWYRPGENEWKSFVSNNLKYDPPKRKKAKKGRYKIQVIFTVDKDGTVSDIIPVTNFGFGLEEEAIRIVSLSSNDWIAAEYNGKRIKSRKIQEIIIEVH